MTWTFPRPRRVSLHLWLYRHRVKLIAVFGALLVAGLLGVAYVTSIVVSRFDGRRWDLPSRIYSDLLVLRAGDTASADRVEAKLQRLLYQREDGRPERPGHFHRQGSVIEIHTRDFRYPGRSFRGFSVRADFSGGRVQSLRDPTGASVPALVIEPERLGSVFGEELQDRSLVHLSELPKSLTDAVLVTEDRDFYRHGGVSIRRSVGAMLANMKGGLHLNFPMYLLKERHLTRAIQAMI
jgi:penicillin-binding protein 1B